MGLCFISGCQNFATSARLPQNEVEQLLAWRSDPRPWARALSWLCNSDGNCEMSATTVKSNLFVRLPLTQLAAALKDPAAQVRAAALLRLDLSSADARAVAEALLSDAAWVTPLAHTVADHAYSVLNAAFPDGYSTRGNAALNQDQGIEGFAVLRMPYVTQAPDWQTKVANYPNTTGVNVAGTESITSEGLDPSALAGFWHGASAQQLEAGLAHRDPTIRLTAFDALLVREQRKDLGVLAIRAFQLGGRRNTGDCIPQAQSIALGIFTAILQSGKLDQATLFLDSLTIPIKTPEVKLTFSGDPLEDIAYYLTTHPTDAKTFAPTLRRWAQAESRYAIAALSAAGLSADLPRLRSVAESGDFSQLLGRDDAPIYAAAKAYYVARRSVVFANQSEPNDTHQTNEPVAKEWFEYVYSLPEAKAVALFSEIFSAATPAVARTEQLRTLYQSLRYVTPKTSIDTLLWQRYQILAPRQADAILTADAKAPETAIRLLSSSTWANQISDVEVLQTRNYCSDYAKVIAPLMHQLPAKAQEKYLLHALNKEPACAIQEYLGAASVKPVTGLQILRARIAREQGETRKILEQALKTMQFWPEIGDL